MKSEFNNHIYNQTAEIFAEKQIWIKNIYDNESAENELADYVTGLTIKIHSILYTFTSI